MTENRSLTIGRVARQAGIGVETVRYYEREGLLPPPPRSAGGYRHYPIDSIRRLRFIRHAKALGFSLAEIRELLSLHADNGASSRAVKRLAEAKLADIDRRIAALTRMREVLAHLTEQCPGDVPRAECPILDALANEPDLTDEDQQAIVSAKQIP